MFYSVIDTIIVPFLIYDGPLDGVNVLEILDISKGNGVDYSFKPESYDYAEDLPFSDDSKIEIVFISVLVLTWVSLYLACLYGK